MEASGSSSYHFRIADEKFAFFDENFFTYTSTEQKRVEDLVRSENERFLQGDLDDVEGASKPTPQLDREQHVDFVLRNLHSLSQSYMSMDASRAWFAFWGIHSLQMLSHKIDKTLASNIIAFLKACEAPNGGYGGGPGQIPHLGTTYAAVMALVSIGTEEAFASIDREKLYKFILSCKQPNGSFVVHEGGEPDIRGAYCAIASAFITNIADEELFQDASSWLIRCQTYEGGFGGEPGCEAHGGYTFCGVASLALLRKSHLINTPSLLRWLVNRQMRFEGGFQGRTNKLVDACYSMWQAANFFTIEFELSKQLGQPIGGLYDEEALQQFVLIAAQDAKRGGLRDKPDKNSDLYHTCYALGGLAVAQSYALSKNDIIGGEENALSEVHPLYNVCIDVERKAKEYFSSRAFVKNIQAESDAK
ncbi:prenyltransferase and squalene oxidase repeat family protein [Aphelenchoides avenae]|nr:prenyltransferase and squalene oxidase repeat family protein [Aphelenchus avenae]